MKRNRVLSIGGIRSLAIGIDAIYRKFRCLEAGQWQCWSKLTPVSYTGSCAPSSLEDTQSKSARKTDSICNTSGRAAFSFRLVAFGFMCI